MSKYIIEDAKRCLQCQTPTCVQGCPIHTPIKEAIALLLKSEVQQAGELLFENNPLSLVCSHVCPQENQCEGHCILNNNGGPVYISAIENYISDYYLNIYQPQPSLKNRGQVAVIGAGPAGLSLAFFLARKNFAVTIFEGYDRIGGILRYGIPEFRLPKTVIDLLGETLSNMGVKIRPNTTIGTNLNIDELFRDEYRAIFIGTGVWRANKIGIKGESLGHVHFAVDYLRNPGVYRLGKSLAVIGSGDVAMDVARTAFRNGCQEVVVVCRGDESTIAARQHEVEYAKIDGARFIFNLSAREITDEGVLCANSNNPGEIKLLPCDSVIIAIGQGPRSFIVSTTKGIDVVASGLVAVDEVGRTTRAGVFAGGDVVTGAKTVVEAVVAARKVATAIEEFIKEKYES